MKPISILRVGTILVALLSAAWPALAQNPGYALRFDGVSDYVELSFTSAILGVGWPTTKTVSLWVKPTGSPACTAPDPASCDVIFGNRPRTFGVTRGVVGGTDRIWVWNNDGSLDKIGIEYMVGEWIHVALVHGGGVLRAYKNGAPAGSVASGATYQPTETVLFLGGIINSSTKNWTFEGDIDEVQLWNVERSALEVFGGAYAVLAGSEPGLAAYYRMSDGAGTTLTDDSAHGRTGTLKDGGGGVPPDGPITWVPSGAFGGGARVNQPPAANAQTVTLSEDTAATTTLIGSDPDGDAITFRIVSQPVQGTLTGTAPNLTYTPAANFHGADGFSFVVNDGWEDSEPASVALTVIPVNDAPTAVADAATTGLDTPVSVSVLANDVDVDGDSLAVTSVDTPLYGAAVTENGRDITYTPGVGFTGSDTFMYTVSDGAGGTSRAQVTVTVGQPPASGSGHPILILENAAYPFSRYYAEILRTEGLNAFDELDIAEVTAAVLAGYDVALLGEMTLTADQASLLGDWVNSGGNLIAMRPDRQLAGLLGLTSLAASLSNGYLQIDGSAAPGAGLVSQSIQFHGTADLYSLNGATNLATLYTDALTTTTSPAVSLNAAGAGKAAAFTYDLARSIVYAHQGNPDWAGQIRNPWAQYYVPLDLFYPDWIDFNKIAIPQADEQQRFLANLISTMNIARKPLPRFWYFPRNIKALVVMTGDDHNGYNGATYEGNTITYFENQKAKSAPGCSVDKWECVRSTSYMFVENPMTDAQAWDYTSQGFEIGLHVNPARNTPDWCRGWTASSLVTEYGSQLNGFYAKYVSLPRQSGVRTHCYSWFQYTDQPAVEASHGIRMDTNVAYWPPHWVQNRPGFMLGSAMPMRFAESTGAPIDVYLAHTIVTDDNGRRWQNPTLHIGSLLDWALGAEGYYGAFTVLAHADKYYQHSYRTANDIIDAALARNVPIISGRQLTTWLDGRNASEFRVLSWDGTSLSFQVLQAHGADGLRGLLPANGPAGRIRQIWRDGIPISFTNQVIKGIEYATFEALGGTYSAVYTPD